MQYEMITSEIAFWNAKIDSLLKIPCETNEAKLNNLTLQEHCSKQIEKLKNSSDLYSMHLESKNFNYRILFSFMENGETLLHLFYERQGKRHTDYSRHTPIAQIRLQELKEELE